MKLYTILIALVCWVCLITTFQVKGQTTNKNFSLIYVETSDTRNKIEAAKLVTKLMEDNASRKDSFLVFISNQSKTELINELAKKSYVSKLINFQNIVPPSARADRNKLLEYFDEHEIIKQKADNSVVLRYNTINIHLFVSKTFMSLFTDQLIYRLLKIKNISLADGNNKQVKIIFHIDKTSRGSDKDYITQITKYDKTYTHEFIEY